MAISLIGLYCSARLFNRMEEVLARSGLTVSQNSTGAFQVAHGDMRVGMLCCAENHVRRSKLGFRGLLGLMRRSVRLTQPVSPNDESMDGVFAADPGDPYFSNEFVMDWRQYAVFRSYVERYAFGTILLIPENVVAY